MEDNTNPVLVSGNIFADLNIPNAGEELERAQFAHAIRSIVQANGWTQEEAAKQRVRHSQKCRRSSAANFRLHSGSAVEIRSRIGM